MGCPECSASTNNRLKFPRKSNLLCMLEANQCQGSMGDGIGTHCSEWLIFPQPNLLPRLVVLILICSGRARPVKGRETRPVGRQAGG
jgi:hypothetical protein